MSFGPNGALIFRQQDKNANYLYRINRDGSGRERLLSTPILNKAGVSPDGEWVIVNRALTEADAALASGGDRAETVAVPLRGGAPRRICAFNCLPGVNLVARREIPLHRGGSGPDGGDSRPARPVAAGPARVGNLARQPMRSPCLARA